MRCFLLLVVFMGSGWAISGLAQNPIPIPTKESIPIPINCAGYGYGELDMFVRGDANTDGEVDLSDVITILNTLFTGKAKLSCEDAADTNDDGELDLSDAIFLLGFLFRGSESLPYPSPGQFGIDQTLKDTLRCESYQGNIPQAGIVAHLVEKVVAGKLQVILGFCFRSKEEYVPLDHITFPVEVKTASPKSGMLSSFFLADINGEIVWKNPVIFFHENDGSWTVNFPDDWKARSNHSYALWAYVSSELNEGDIINAQIDTTVIGLYPPYRLGPTNYIMGGPTAVEHPKLTIEKDPVNDSWVGFAGPGHSGPVGGEFILQTREQDIALKILLHIRQINPHSYGDPEDYIIKIYILSWDGRDTTGYKQILSADLPRDQMRGDQHAEIEIGVTVPAHASTKMSIHFVTHWNTPQYTATGQQFQFFFGHDDIKAVNAATGNQVTVDINELAFQPTTFYNSWLDIQIELFNENRVEGGELIKGRFQPLYRYGISSHPAVSGLYRNTFLLEGTKNVKVENFRLHDGKRTIAYEFSGADLGDPSSDTWKRRVFLEMHDTAGKKAVYVILPGPQFEKQLHITLLGDIGITDSSPAFLSIRMLGDEEFPKVSPSSVSESAGNFIWTDFALSGPVEPWSDPGVLMRRQWSNGQRVQGLCGYYCPVVFRN